MNSEKWIGIRKETAEHLRSQLPNTSFNGVNIYQKVQIR